MAEKKESDLKAVLVIVIMSAVCAGGLALVKAATAERILESDMKAEADAVKKVLPEGCTADTARKVYWVKDKGVWTEKEGLSPVEKEEALKERDSADVIYPGFKDGALCGMAVKTRAEKGYSGKIVMLVGFKQLESVDTLKMHRLFILEQSETPGLGAKSILGQEEDPAKLDSKDPKKYFCLNFFDKEVKKMTFEVKKADYVQGSNDVAAITASTITSKAVTGAVKAATERVKSGLDAMKAEFAKTPAKE